MTDYTSDEGIDLDFGGVDSITGFMPVPTGAYSLEITEAAVVPTKDQKNRLIKVSMRVCEGPLAGRSIGMDNWFIPNRVTQEQAKFETTAGYFKGKLEAVLSRTIGDNFKLNVRELPGTKFKGVVTLEDTGYGPQNKVTTYLRSDADLSNIVLPTPRPPVGTSNNASSGDTAGGKFRI